MTKPLPKSARTVTIASKLQHDVLLHIDTKKEVRVTGQYGANTEEQYVPGEPVCILGVQRPRGEIPENYPMPEIRNGYALTRNVDADWWEAWLAQHRDMDMVKNNLIFVELTEAAITEHAKELKDVRAGTEPINPTNDPRMPRVVDQNLSRITPDDRRSAA